MNLLPTSALLSRVPASSLFRDWRGALPHVPFRALYRIEAQARPGRTASTIEKLSRVAFVFRVSSSFVADVAFQEGRLAPPVILRAESLAFRLTTLSGPEGLLTPLDAVSHLESFLARQSPEACASLAQDLEQTADDGAELVKIFRRIAWVSLRLDHPFAAGVIEPVYTVRKAVGGFEFRIGARTGHVEVALPKPSKAPSP